MDFTKSECAKWLKNKEVNPRTNRPIKVGKGVYNKLEKVCQQYELVEGASGRQSAKKKSDLFTKEECEKWLKDKSINPRTNRKIKENGPVYKSLELECAKLLDIKVKTPSKSPKRKTPSKLPPKKGDKLVTKAEVYNYMKAQYNNIIRSDMNKMQYKEAMNIISNVYRRKPTQDNVLNLYTVEDANVYYIRSESTIEGKKVFSDSFGLRDWILNKIYNYDKNDKARKPKFVRNKGWMYYKNNKNKIRMDKLQYAINNTNLHFTGYEIIAEQSPVEKGAQKQYGVIGWEVPFDEPDWLTDITGKGWDPKFNPSIDAKGSIKFNKCAISLNAAEKSIKMLRTKTKNGEKVWSSLSPTFIFFPGGKIKLKNFLASKEYNTVLIGWSNHARFGFKDENLKEFYIYDPWKQSAGGANFQEIKDAAKDEGYETKFVKRNIVDQAMGEGSCANVALMRAIMTAEYGISGAYMDIPYEYAILAQRLISMKR